MVDDIEIGQAWYTTTRTANFDDVHVGNYRRPSRLCTDANHQLRLLY